MLCPCVCTLKIISKTSISVNINKPQPLHKLSGVFTLRPDFCLSSWHQENILFSESDEEKRGRKHFFLSVSPQLGFIKVCRQSALV